MTIDAATKRKIISDYMKTPTGRHKLAAAMVQPVRLRIDYMSFLTRVLSTSHMPLARCYETDGFDPEKHTHGTLREWPLHKMKGLVAEGNFSEMEQMQQEMVDSIVAWHNRMLVSLLADNLVPMEKMPKPYENGRVLMDPSAHAWFRKNMGPHEWDPVCTAELLRTGLFGEWGGSEMFISRFFPVGVVLFTPAPDVLGTVATQTDVLHHDDPRSLSLGFATHSYAFPQLHENHPPVYAWPVPTD